jgi:penicillin-binding protein 2
MQNKIIKPGEEISDSGVLQVKSKTIDGRIDQFINYKSTNLGVLDLKKAIAKSSDVFFYFLVGGDPETGKIPFINDSNRQNPLGVNQLDEGLRQYFGFGEKTGVDLDLENKGVLPTPEYKESRGLGSWFLGDDYQTAIGQGFFLSTPLQMARATAVFANGGTLVTPHLVSSQNDQKRASGLDTDVLNYITSAMRGVVLEGTAKRLQDNRSSIAAKTGSAQFDPKNPEKVNGWVVSFNQNQDIIKEKLVVVVLTENIDKTAEYITVPITNKIWQEIEKNWEGS